MTEVESTSEFRLLLATDRSGMLAVFLDLCLDGQSATVSHIPLAAEALAHRSQDIVAASVVVVDASVDPVIGLQLCRNLQQLQPSLPVVALFCCSHSVSLHYLRALADAGVSGMLDLHATAEEIAHVLLSAVQGDLVIRLEMNDAETPLWRQILAGSEVSGEPPVLSDGDVEVLRLLTLGLSENEMGRRLHLSPHTVKHRVEELRQRVGAPNRIALAAWAGWYGLYRPELVSV